MKKIQSKKLLMGRLGYGKDLLQEITDICLAENIGLGRVEAIGAVQKACIGFYDQKARDYQFRKIEQALEIVNLTGNVSMKEGHPFVHAHISLADHKGNVYGGHLAPGTTIFACELIVEVFEGAILERTLDEETGLPLW